MDKRVVREKMGSGFVFISMFLQLEASRIPNDPMKRKKLKIARYVEYGMALLVGSCYGLSLAFFVFLKGDLKL
ncbi:hypothetical protein HHK36_003155 [Tetracentron sinense]|uniref:Uncharacterized protein n=1 Tax=Tetracentron sinense TaxID=13715 RepID=A0A835DNE2_TETSI|nr:hypothetical protein HHK36_003155 [Tetracentron sinense]